MKISIFGYGVVGQGVYEMISKAKGLENGLVFDKQEKCTESFMVSDIDKILSDESVDTVVECMGGIDVPYRFVKMALEAGKNVVSSNKALIAAKGLELQKLADSKKVSLLFSAACGGAIPVLHNLSVARETDSIIEVCGILNGTTNFILTKMADENLSYENALKLAQEKGYAEADPTADVSGMDTMRKIILASAVSFNQMPIEGYNVEGIEFVQSNLPKGYCLRLVGSCGLVGKEVYAFVQPTLVKNDSLMASVKANYNMAVYEGQNSGKISLGGQGAGRYPTASAVLRDITALQTKGQRMIKEDCTPVKAQNSKKVFDYYVIEDDKISECRTDVASIFERAKNSREAGHSFFFAAYQEK